MADEPFVLYAGDNKAVSSLSWSESDTQTYFFTADEEGRRALNLTKVLKSDVREKVRNNLKKNGGLLISANDRGDGEFVLKVDVITAGKYKAPNRFLLCGAGGDFDWRDLNAQLIYRARHEMALIPVDHAAEMRLGGVLSTLSGLPEDLRGAILRAMVRSNAPIAAPGTAKERPAWIPALAGLVVGMILGAALSAGYNMNHSHGKAPGAPVQNSPNPATEKPPAQTDQPAPTVAPPPTPVAITPVAPQAPVVTPGAQTTAGTVKTRSATGFTFDAGHGKSYAATIAAGADVKKNGVATQVDALQAGDKVSVEGPVKGAGIVATKIVASSPAPLVLTGVVFKALDAEKIVVSVNGAKKTLLVDNATCTKGSKDGLKIADSPEAFPVAGIKVGDTVEAIGIQTDVGFRAQHLVVVVRAP